MYDADQSKDTDRRADASLGDLQDAEYRLGRAEDMTLRHVGATVRWISGSARWDRNGVPLDFATAVAEVKSLADQYVGSPGDPVPPHGFGTAVHIMADLEKARTRFDDARLAVDLIEQEWDANGRWSRYFGVRDGHVHSSPQCAPLRSTTHLIWLTDFAAETPESVVNEHGGVLCSRCFPDGPPHWYGEQFKTKRQREFMERRAKRQRDFEAKKAVDPVTGKFLRGFPGHWWPRTERSVHLALITAMVSLRMHGLSHPDAEAWEAFIEKALEALAAKRGISDPESLREDYTLRSDRKYQKYRREIAARADNEKP